MEVLSKYTFEIVTLLALLLAAGCGGAQLAGPVADGPGKAGQPLPSVFDEFRGEVTRGASDVTTIPGSDAASNSGGTVVDTTMVLDSAGSSSNMAWALYKVSGLSGRRASTLGVELSLPQMTTEYSIGVANFSEGVWDFLDTVSGLPEYTYDLTQEEAALVSQLGNLYFLVVVSGGNSATVLQASVISELETGENPTLPLRAQRPSVSEGLPDRIEISWTTVSGAVTYELWRRVDGTGGYAWELLATQAELSYTDTAIDLSTEYSYKVRGVNSAGAGGFSDKRSGFAGEPPLGFDEENDEDMEVEGTITAIGETSFSIGQFTFTVTANTLIEGDDHEILTLADLAVGDFVEVEADSDLLGGWIAREVEVEDDDNGGGDDEEELEFEGELQAISATSATVNDLVFIFDARTEFEDMNDNMVDWTFFEVGDIVSVDAIDNDGTLIATELELEQQGPGGGGEGQQRFAGLIETINEGEIVIGGVSITLDASTLYLDNAGNTVDITFFSAGMNVGVEAFGSEANGWVALQVKEELDGQGGGEQTFIGLIDSISETEVIVDGTTIALTTETILLDNAGNAVDLSHFTVGMNVDVEALGSEAEGWTATQMKEDIPE
jgi:hypothetical protein